MKQPTVAAAALTSTPVSNILTVSGASFGAFGGTHYVKFTSGGDNGKFFAIASNDATTITLDLNGDTLTASSGDTFSVTKFWTLAELFVPAQSTTNPTTTGNAIVASTSSLASGRRTEVLLPNTTGTGVNLASTDIYYIFNGAWRKAGQPATTSFDATQLWPDNYFIIRHPVAVTSNTTYTATGEVETGNFSVALTTRNSVRQDNFIGIPRPIDVSLDGLSLGNTSAFLTSTSSLASGRRDELLIFDNALAARNKAPSSIYYYFNGAWRKAGQPATTNFGTDLIKAGSGILIRKYQVSGGPTQFWNNTPTY